MMVSPKFTLLAIPVCLYRLVQDEKTDSIMWPVFQLLKSFISINYYMYNDVIT